MTQSTNELLTGIQQIIEHLERSGLHWLPKPNDGWATAWSTADGKMSQPLNSNSVVLKTESTSGVEVASAAKKPEFVSEAIAVRIAEGDSEQAVAMDSSKGASKLSFPVPPSAQASSATLTIAGENWAGRRLPLDERAAIFQTLNEQVVACRKCEELACSRKQTVFGVGSLEARVAFFGEAPGADEDRQGEPFVGAAGQLLNKIIAATKMKREEVYILNSLKCRPPGNRTPVDEEIAKCRPFFESQLDVIQPEFIVCLGAVAARAVLQSNDSVGRLRGRFHRYRGARVLVTYHPAYLLRNESAKRFVWEDMQFLMKAMGIST